MNNLQHEFLPVVMSIAEFDPFAQAGTIADLKTFAAHSCYGVAAVTALVLQQPGSKAKLQPVVSSWLKESILSLVREQPICAIKVGKLCGRAGAEVVCEVLNANPSVPLVLDPDLDGGLESTDLEHKAGLELVRSLLLPRATVVTPNLAEAAALTAIPVRSSADMKTAAAKLVEMGARSAVVTGGNLDKPFDVYFDAELSETLAGERFKVDAPHGTGATFSSAIAANLALGRHPHDAVVMAKAFVTEALRKAHITASGTILLNHFYRTHQAARVVDSESGIPERTL